MLTMMDDIIKITIKANGNQLRLEYSKWFFQQQYDYSIHYHFYRSWQISLIILASVQDTDENQIIGPLIWRSRYHAINLSYWVSLSQFIWKSGT